MNAEVLTTPTTLKILRPRALIIEDDKTLQPIWDYVLKLVQQDMTYQWVDNALAAELALQKAETDQHPYDIVISDIYLSSQKTGIDLWKQFASSLKGKMLLVSSMSFNKLSRSMDNHTPMPLFIQKPLRMSECIEAVHGLMHYRQHRYRQ